MRRFIAALVGGVVGGVVGGLVCASLVSGRNAPPVDPADAYLAENRAAVERKVMADVEKYGVDIYRLYLEISQALPGLPGADFAVDKAVKKLAVTYPESYVRHIAEAYVVYGAIRKRDMLQIERYLGEVEQAGRQRQLMPNGYEIVPQLVTAQYNYYFHIGRFDEAAQTLDYLQEKFGNSFIFQPQGKPLRISDFVEAQRRVLEVVRAKEGT